MIELRRGTFKIIRVDGSEQLIERRPTIDAILHAIDCDILCTVTLDRRKQIVMLVDDVGAVNDKPTNPKATELYHAVCKPGTVHAIHGDVAIVNDEDFA